ncbi:hypothetical protein B484DRAFT_407289, partial [Ochromonadaceae sp. CCMP2298]
MRDSPMKAMKTLVAPTLPALAAGFFASLSLYTAKVDATPLDVRQMAKAAYRGHVKFE